MKEKIKELRIKIDGLSQLTKELKPIMNIHVRDGKKTNTKEIEKAYDSLILAKAWLGKVLGELGKNTPYANDGNRKTVEDIEPTADKNTEVVFGDKINETPFRDKNHIEKVDWLRTEIETISNVVLELEGGKLNTASWTEYTHEIKMFSYKHLCEARFWLGFELQRIRENG